MDNKVVIRRKKTLQIILSLVGVLALVGYASDLSDSPTTTIVSWAVFAVVAGAVLLFIIALIAGFINGRHHLIIDTEGFSDYESPGGGRISWSEVASIRLAPSLPGGPEGSDAASDGLFIQVTFRDESRNTTASIHHKGKILDLKQAGFGGLLILTTNFRMPPEQIVDIMRQYHQRSVAATSASPSPVLPNN